MEFIFEFFEEHHLCKIKNPLCTQSALGNETVYKNKPPEFNLLLILQKFLFRISHNTVLPTYISKLMDTLYNKYHVLISAI